VHVVERLSIARDPEERKWSGDKEKEAFGLPVHE